ncbi:hypothetical protein MTP99_006172 [Tenebrio molitor]|nr:hypothetical protein MTP99_006172 [Tenebrio molitor]
MHDIQKSSIYISCEGCQQTFTRKENYIRYKTKSCINSTPPPLVKKPRLEEPTSASTSTAITPPHHQQNFCHICQINYLGTQEQILLFALYEDSSEMAS